MTFRTELAGDGAVHGQSIPCACGDGFIVHGGRACLNCGAPVEGVTAAEEATTWDELEALVDAQRDGHGHSS